MTYRKKLIEVAVPLDAINKASVREKSLRHGHPSTLHLWWSRKPLATCRAVLFASLVDDPAEHPELFPTEEEQNTERTRLFKLMEELVKWENSNNEDVLARVRAEIDKYTDGNPPPVLDPFAGGGSIPLEAQRLGLEAHASDLNPVAVLINKALIEIPPKFAGQPPVNPEAKKTLLGGDWQGAHGLADDIRYYGKWMSEEAERRIGHLYPKVALPKEYGGGEGTVIAYIWTRTVACPNPVCGAQMPLASSWWLSKKKGKETWIEPTIDRSLTPSILKFLVKTGQGKPPEPPKVGRGAQFKCLCCGNVANEQYIKEEGMAGRMSSQMIAVVAEGKKGRMYLPPALEQETVAKQAEPHWRPEQDMPKNPRWFSPPIYGMAKFGDIFTPRQLVVLNTFIRLLQEVRERILNDANTTGLVANQAYAEAIATYLALAVDKCADYWSSICSWHTGRDTIRNTFARQAIPMFWDFAETNPFSESTGNFLGAINWVTEVVQQSPCAVQGQAAQRDATAMVNGISQPLISTDPPYYDNIGYADLSDFFYVWLRRSLSSIYPELFSTMLVPKAQELVATPYRFNGSKSEAQKFFETGLSKVFEHMRTIQNPDYPLTVYYAFKQAESETEMNNKDNGNVNGSGAKATASTGWETMLEGLIQSGFAITGTWPIRTEMMNRSVGQDTNALASSIVLVCRPRPINAPIIMRKQFINELKMELSQALKKMQHGGIAPVDLAQASIGPGMKVFSQYSKVVESDGTALRVRTALQLINQVLDEALAEQEGEFDLQTRWAVSWFEQYAMEEGQYGVAETLSKARNISLHTLEEAGILLARGGKVRLLKREEYGDSWGGRTSSHLTAWEVTQRMINALMNGRGEQEAGAILRQARDLGEPARDLAYRLYTICERKGWSAEALPYNTLVMSWPQVSGYAHKEIVEAPTLWATID
jgi:putative DNA methylase